MILSQVCFAVDQTIYPKKLIMDLLKNFYQSSKHHISRDLAFSTSIRSNRKSRLKISLIIAYLEMQTNRPRQRNRNKF